MEQQADKLKKDPGTLQWCGYEWGFTMENGRLIDRKRPFFHFTKKAVSVKSVTNILELGVMTDPAIIRFNGEDYYSIYGTGLIRSVDTFGYGSFSADITLPKGKNLWPSFWLVGEGRWPYNGEIDIMEAWSNTNGSYLRSMMSQFPYFVKNWRTTNNVHWVDEKEKHKMTRSKGIPKCKQQSDPSNVFVNYSVEWDENMVSFYVDGKLVRSYGQNIAKYLRDKRMRVVFNFWLDNEDFGVDTNMLVRNFKYSELE